MSEAAKTQQRASADDPIALFVATGGQRSLRFVIWLILAALAVVNGLSLLQRGEVTNPLVLFIFIAIALLTLMLLHRQKFHAAFIVFLWGIMLSGMSTAFLVSGFQTPAMFFVPLSVMLAAWLLTVRDVALMVAVTVVGYAAITVLQSQGLLPEISRSPLTWGIAFAFITVICAILGLSLTAAIRSQYRRALLLSDELTNLNQDLDHKVVERTAELQTALDRVRRMQDDLIQSEKMASLGSMVAGISHELNTPIGNAVTILSTISQRSEYLVKSLAEGGLKKSDLVNNLADIKSMSELAEDSVNRAAVLVANFRQVAADQVSERRRAFDLREVVEENLYAFRLGIEGKPWVVNNTVLIGIKCDSFPGPLGQVISNLIQNAIVHGFSGRDQGTIVISANVSGDMLELVVSDDGVGMDTSTLVRVFEPFFTTKLGKGGSGLGLAMCYRIANTVLAGSIRAISSPGTGTQFIVRMPLRTPGTL